MSTVCPTIGSLGSGFYFSPETLAVGKEMGLDGLRWYILGRGGVLGNVEAPVVSAAFGYFNPSLIDKMWNSARAVIEPRTAGARYHLCAAEYGRRAFADIAGLEGYNAAAEKVVAAADRDGLSLFAGIAAEPLVDDPAGRAMQLTAVLRELRGSAHLAAVVGTGLRARNAHALKRPNDLQMFGYADGDIVATPSDQAKLDAAERATDDMLRPAFAVLDDGEAGALTDGTRAMQAALA